MFPTGTVPEGPRGALKIGSAPCMHVQPARPAAQALKKQCAERRPYNARNAAGEPAGGWGRVWGAVLSQTVMAVLASLLKGSPPATLYISF
jgi:hypothetical protein